VLRGDASPTLGLQGRPEPPVSTTVPACAPAGLHRNSGAAPAGWSPAPLVIASRTPTRTGCPLRRWSAGSWTAVGVPAGDL